MRRSCHVINYMVNVMFFLKCCCLLLKNVEVVNVCEMIFFFRFMFCRFDKHYFKGENVMFVEKHVYV